MLVDGEKNRHTIVEGDSPMLVPMPVRLQEQPAARSGETETRYVIMWKRIEDTSSLHSKNDVIREWLCRISNLKFQTTSCPQNPKPHGMRTRSTRNHHEMKMIK